MRRLGIRVLWLVACFVSLAAAHAQESVDLPFDMPTPSGWRTETIPFPLDFAPELDYEGLEELRFSPGMFIEKKVDFWSYAFVWWVPEDTAFDTERLQADLETYFRGLNRSMGEARGFDPGDTEIDVQLEPVESDATDSPQWKGTARTVDVFTTRRPVRLNVRIDLTPCPDQEYVAAIFQLSPQPRRNVIWQVLDGIREGFRCQP